MDYHPRGAVAASVDVILTRDLTGSNIASRLTIPKETLFTDVNGNSWLSARDVTWYANVTTCKIPLIQHEKYNQSGLSGLVIPSEGRPEITIGKLPDGKYYEHGTMQLSIDGTTWTLVDTFAYSKPSDKHFMVTINASQVAVIVFGDGTFGSIPSAGQKITLASFYITTGIQGNVPAGSIVQTPAIVKASISEATTSNQYAAGGGSSYENFGMLKEHIPLSVKTLGVAVSKQDFVDLAMLIDGVNKAAVDYECGRKLTVYISADNGGVADSAMINKVYTQLSQRAPLTTWLQVKSAGLVDITLEIEVTGKKSYKTNEIQAQVLNALYNAYSIENSEIGGKVRISDIYALIDNLSTVDYLHIKKFYIKPWPVTIYGNKELLLGQFKLEKANGSMTYFINFTGSNSYTVKSSSGGFQTTGTVGSTINITDKANGITFSLDIQANGYQQGYRYSITISEPNMDYEDPGYNLPVFQKSSQLTLTVHETV